MLRLATHTRDVPVFTSPAFSTPANLFLRFPVLPFPPMRFGPVFSSSAFSIPMFSVVPSSSTVELVDDTYTTLDEFRLYTAVPSTVTL